MPSVPNFGTTKPNAPDFEKKKSSALRLTSFLLCCPLVCRIKSALLSVLLCSAAAFDNQQQEQRESAHACQYDEKGQIEPVAGLRRLRVIRLHRQFLDLEAPVQIPGGLLERIVQRERHVQRHVQA